MSTNRYPALCARCKGYVEPGDGFVSGGRSEHDDGWRIVHNSCIPVVDLSKYQKPSGYDL